MKMKLLTLALAVASVSIAYSGIDAGELANLALKDTVNEAQASIAASKVPADRAIAILPLGGDGSGPVEGLLKTALTNAGKTCVEGKEDPMWDEILKEIEWDERKEDILDPATLDKLGKLKSAQYLLYGSVRRLASSERYVLIELELHVSCIATKQHVWGGSFVRRHYAPDADPKGALDIPVDVRVALIDGIRAKVSESLAKSSRLDAVKRVVILPLAGDNDQYTKGLFRDVLSKSSVTPIELDVTTRAEARFALREGPGKADAIAYGVLRELSAKVLETMPTGEEVRLATIELQLCIENALTREIVWSDTVQFEKKFGAGTDEGSWWDKLCHLFPFLKDHPAAIVWLPLAVLLGLIVLFKLFGAMTRVR